MKSKTIILSSENNKGRGILTLFQEDDLLQCRIRLYNINKLNKFCKLGIYHSKQVYSANLLEKQGVYSSSMVGNFEIDEDFYSAIIDTSNNNEVILSGGTYAGYFFDDHSVFNEEETIEEQLSPIAEETPKPTQTNDKVSFVNNQQNISCEDCDKCENCVYKEYFYSHNNLELNKEDEQIEENTNFQESTILTNQINKAEEQNNTTILESLQPQFKYVFENYPQDEVLNKLIPNSKFVKIGEEHNSYSIGAIYENENMKYICYAVLCNYNEPAPKELGEHYQWLPLDKEDPLSEGYYIVFQDANDLKIVEL